jgi:starch synthase
MANTVSPAYADEITQAEDPSRYFEGGKGLHDVARRLRDTGRLIGILNGFQYRNEFSEPGFKETLERKRAAKAALGAYFHAGDSILFGFVGRAVEQKFRLLGEWLDGRPLLEHILDIPGVNVAVLATGQPEYETFIGNLSLARFTTLRSYDHVLCSSRRGNYACTVAFDRQLGERISLGSDVFLMPSLFEPCGIAQLESMSNATPPLVRRTGGLADTVVPHDDPDGTGFVFDGSTPRALLTGLLDSVKTACDVYRDAPRFAELQARAARARFRWSDSAKQYLENMYLRVL